MFPRFLVAPPLAGLAKMAGPKDKRLFLIFKSYGFEMILVRIVYNVVAQAGLAALGIRVISLSHGGVLMLGFDRKANCLAGITGHLLDSNGCCYDLSDFQLDLDNTGLDLTDLLMTMLFFF